MFSKEKLNEELKKQIEALLPAMKKLNFVGDGTGPYWDKFFHRSSGVNVEITPIKARKLYGYFDGFKLKVTRGYYLRHSSRNTVLIGIDNMDAVKKAILDSISHRRETKKSERANKSFKQTLEKTLPRFFPGRDIHVTEGEGQFSATIMDNKPDGKRPIIKLRVHRDGQIASVEISYPGRELEDVVKLLEVW
jgi:hypothetical protein